MNQPQPRQSPHGPGPLADLMAELLERFRHFSGPGEPVPGLASHLARLKVSGRLLQVLAGPLGRGGEGILRLSGVLSEWVASFESAPESYPHHLVYPVERLADFLEDLLAQADRGIQPSELIRDPGWEVVLETFRHAGTPLAVMDDIEALFVNWGSRWSESNLTPNLEHRLQRRWLSVRKKGDALFNPAQRQAAWDEDSWDAVARPGEILLLVDSAFRRDEIQDKLVDRNYQVELPLDPAQALEFVATGPVPLAILCDNLEPTRHLVHMKEGLARQPKTAKIPLVLVVGSTLDGAAEGDRARQLGAAAAWTEPFDPEDLYRILQRLSQP